MTLKNIVKGVFTYNTAAVVTLRIIIGAVFIYSGFVKAIDLWGFLFKISDYLTVWHTEIPRSIILVGAIALSAYEFLFGSLLLLGCFKRWAPIMLSASMAVMLPLTLYVWIANPIDDCGCFGDALKLSNVATFFKNVVITIGLIYLVKNNSSLKKGVFHPSAQWIVCCISLLYITSIALLGYNVQPLIDYRPYPVGTDLYTTLTDTPNNEPGLTFIYKKDGRTEEFSINNLPDSTWTFVERIEPASNPDETGFSIYNEDGDEIYPDEVISDEGEQLILVLPEPARADISYTYAINEFESAITAQGGSMICLTASGKRGIDIWKDLSMAEYPCYTVDDTSLKALVRGTPSLVYLRDGIIGWKRTVASFDFDKITKIGRREISLKDAVNPDANLLIVLTAIAFGGLALPWLCQTIATIIRRRKNIG